MGSFWKEAWEGSESGEFLVLCFFLAKRFRESVSLGLRSGGCREKNQRRRRGGESRR